MGGCDTTRVPEDGERHFNIHTDPETMAGHYANFANVSHSDYEFTITFARVDHEVEEGEVPGVVEGEGMLRMRDYTESSREALARAGAAAGVELQRGLRTVAATDALIALRAGYATCLLGGVDETKFPSNYHWPSDTPDNLDWSSVERAVEVCVRYLSG
jgi:hypothetical protein